jgi:hypothetical protein
MTRSSGAALALLFSACTCGHRPPGGGCPAPGGIAWAGFHGNRERLGWNDAEPALGPAAVGGGHFGVAWQSPALDPVTIGGTVFAAHAYASPLYLDGITLRSGTASGLRLSVIVAATSSGTLTAVNAFASTCAGRPVDAGAILWNARLGVPALTGFDGPPGGGMPMGILSTPVADLDSDPPRVYAVAWNGNDGFLAYAVDLGTGATLPGWPVSLDPASVAAARPGSPPFLANPANLQRSALNLDRSGDRLYVPFSYHGWMFAIDTRSPSIAAAFPVGPQPAPPGDREMGGIWGPGGAAVDREDRLHFSTGNGPEAFEQSPGYWPESLLQMTPELALTGTFTPWNFCQLEVSDIDLGGGSPIALPDLDAATTTTPRLLALGGKQGNVYLLDRDRLPGRLDVRPACLSVPADAAKDPSLLPPGSQPQFGGPGPLNVFGPYEEGGNNGLFAKMRSTPAFFRDAAGQSFLFVSGTTKAAPCCGADGARSIPPSVVRLRVATSPGGPAYLAVEGADTEVSFLNPGSPIVTSQAGRDPVVWVLDENGGRFDPLVPDPANPAYVTPRPMLYALDGSTMKLLWKSAANALETGGKYSTPVAAHGQVFVVTDRVTAFGVR